MWPFSVKLPNRQPSVPKNILCPYCGYDLKIAPQRKKKCPNCSQYIYTKYTPDNHTKRLMTEKQAKDAEEQWTLHHLRQSSLSTLAMFGYDEGDLEREIAIGAKNDNDAVFRILNRFTLLKKQDYHKLKMAFLIQASYAEQTGKDFRPFLSGAHLYELLNYQSTGGVVKQVEILNSGQKNTCIECQSNKGKIYNIDEALKLMPLPCAKCTCVGVGGQVGYCECRYAAVLPKY